MGNQIRPDDNVELHNKTKEDKFFLYDGREYRVPGGSYIPVKRNIAEHGINKTVVTSDGNNYKRTLHIVELPPAQRSTPEVSIVVDKLEQLTAENAALKVKIEQLEAENKELRAKKK